MQLTKKPLRYALFALLFSTLLIFNTAYSQSSDEDSSIKLSDQEVTRLRAVIDLPVDPNSLKASRVQAYKLKHAAAWKLGDVVKQEEVLREWAQMDTDIDPRWRLMSFLFFSTKRQEGFQLGQDLVKEIKYAPSAVRIRSALADQYMHESNLKQASALLSDAETIIKNEWGRVPRQGQNAYWILRAEMEFNLIKSVFLRRSGKWQEGVQTAKLAASKGKELIGIDTIVDEQQRNFSRNGYVSAMAQVADHQSAAGLYAEADMSLREAFQFGKSNGFTDNQLVRVFNGVAWLRNATGRFEDGLAYSNRSEKIILGMGVQKGAASWLYTQTPGTLALAGMDRWQEAVEKFDAIDREMEQLKTKSPAAFQAWLRGPVYLHTARYPQAKKLYEGTLKWHVENFGEHHYFTAYTRGMYAIALWRNGEPAGARVQFDQAIQNITSPDALTGDFTEDVFRRKGKKYIFQNYIDLLATTADKDAKDAAIIFQMADHLSSSSVQQALSDAAVRSGVNVPGLSDVIRKEQDAKNEAATLMSYITSQGSEGDKRRNPQVIEQMQKRMRELEGLRKEYKAQIQKGFPEYFQLIQPKAPSHTDIAQQLKPDELFVSILPMEKQTYVWAIDSAGKVNFHQWPVGEKEGAKLVDKIRKTLDVAGLGNKAPAFDYADAHTIYKGIFGPIESEMADKKHLIVATSGAFANMPLGVLVRKPVTSPNPLNAAWLIKDAAISHVPTASGWLSLKRYAKVPSSTQPLIAWGDPLFDNKVATQQIAGVIPKATTVRSVIDTRSTLHIGLERSNEESYLAYSKIPPLPETRDEVIELAKILAADPKQDLILGSDATRQSVLKSSASGQLGKKQVVVFATHGLLAGDLPNLNQPALAMASTANPADSPLLTLEDVLGLKLNADWVVLSACNTAGADGRAEEALSGLARGFFFAGSRSLLVTHWSVESESAMLLTTHTFAAYKKDPQMRRAEALKQAMVETMKLPQYAHPAYWAPYALVGEGGR
jgi:CHAT domain-containing protein